MKNKETKAKAKNVTERLRVFHRAMITGEVLIHNDDRLYVAPLANISAGGIFVKELQDIREGTVVRVVVKSPRFSEPVQARGTIVRIQNEGSRGSAIEFTSIASRDRETIQKCVYETRLESVLAAA